MRCPECEQIKSFIYPETALYFSFPLDNTREKVLKFLAEQELEHRDVSGLLRIEIREDRLPNFFTRLSGVLEGQELEATKVLPRDAQDDTDTLHLNDFNRIMPLNQLIARSSGVWLVDILQNESYTSLFQPIFNADGKTPFAYEALFRGLDDEGKSISPGLIFQVAEDADLLFQVDLAARRSAVENAAAQKLGDKKLFINFNPSSIYDPAYCLKTTTQFIQELGLGPADIVFEVVESHEVRDYNHLKGILAFYRRAGFRVALDDVGAGYAGLTMLQEIRPDFIKIDMKLIRNVDTDSYKQNIVRPLIEMGHQNSARVICEGIETEGEMAWLQDNGADFLQGFYLSKPAAEIAA